MAVQTVFNQYATEYDEARKRLIPCFDDLYQTVVDIIPFQSNEKISVLDLGAGTGLVSGLLAASYPNAHFTLVDIADKMLEQAKIRLRTFGRRFEYSLVNYADSDISGEYDLIVSALSIHHLEDRQKEHLFKRIFSNLTAGGMFINADQVNGETSEIDDLYRRKWISTVRTLGCSEDELNAAFERMKEDKMSTLSHQLEALKKANFFHVNCWFKHFSFVVYSGQKQGFEKRSIK